MSEPFYSPNRKPDPPRQPKPGEHLWTFTRGADQRRAELRDFGETGAELQIFAGDEFLSGQHFLARELAVIQARRTRESLEKAGWTCARCQGEFWIYAPNATAVPCDDCNTSDPPRPPKGFVSYMKGGE